MKKLFWALCLCVAGGVALPPTAVAGADWKVIHDSMDGSVRTIAFTKSTLEPPLVSLGPIVFVYPGVRPDLGTINFNESFAVSLAKKGFTSVPGAHVGSKIGREFDLGGSSLNSKLMFAGAFDDFKPIAAEMAEKNGQVINWAGVGETLVSGVALAAGALLNNQYLGVAGMTMASQQSQFGSFKKDDTEWFKVAPDMETSGGPVPVQVAVVKSLLSRYDSSGFFERSYLDPIFLMVITYKKMPDDKLIELASNRLAEQVKALAPPIPELNDKQKEWLNSR